MARRFFLVLTVFFASIFAAGLALAGAPGETAGPKPARTVGVEAVWSPDARTIQAVKQRCAEAAGGGLEECLAEAMEDAGASKEAAAFTRSFAGGAFVRRFRETGRVDVAYVSYPFRSSESHGLLLVNGEPPIVDVDDIALIPKDAMGQDKTYGAIRKSYPRVTMWPGDRPPKQAVPVEALPGGGQGFAVGYALRNFCHACEIVGNAYFSFDFAETGRLSAIRFLRCDLPPKKTKVEARRVSEQISFVVMAEEGKEFTVRLSSNRTTGYQWRPAGPLDDKVVRLVRCDYVPFEGAPLGGGGEDIFTFLAAGKGATEITMEYVRSWERHRAPAKTATIRVSVRPASPR